MAAKKEITKSGFIRQHPNDKPEDIVAKAKEAGLEISVEAVYKIRSADKIRARKKRPLNASAAKKARKRAKPPSPVKDFIRSLPKSLSIEEVLKRAKEAGLKPPHPQYIYSVRSTMSNARKAPGTSLAVVKKAALAKPGSSDRILTALQLKGEDDEATQEILRVSLRVGLLQTRTRINQILQTL